ncbi:hypothetical protein ALC56_10336 [Trachymyrmex septentrionalis]|uniref:Uncharacterized protein n=1 Tax=Trachymyrmex septentrionalis TaxID=34720 RepID=A0A195F4R2_9HYME|nr:hypothetical protein ALC56_10336 [Trachymyrmex septentrionalis]
MVKERFSHRESKHLNQYFWGCYIVSYTVSGHFRNAIKINSGGLVGAENPAFEKVYRF